MNSIPWNYDFSRIVGSKSSASANFQDLVSQLLAADIGAETIDGIGGDLGIDCYLGRFRGRLTAFQVKYFLGRLRKSQRVQIKRSLEVAVGHHDIAVWILCTPGDPTPNERDWLNGLGPPTEWWGETKLRSLLAQYPGIARQFFSEPVLESRLAAVEEEISRLRHGLLSRIDTHPAAAQILSYLAHAEKDCLAAAEDARALRAGSERPWIAIDFCELCGYLSADPTFAVHRPLVDFCLAHSPSPIILPPGTVYEMGMFVRRSVYRLDAEDFLDRVRRTPEAHFFVQEFTADPTSSASTAAYRSFVARMRDWGVDDKPEVSRLSASLQSGTIRPAPDGYRSVQADEFNEALHYFMRVRPGKGWANHADAANIEFLMASANHGRMHSRMISSARSMSAASEELCAGRAVVRTPRQFALSLTAGDSPEHAHERLAQALAEIRGMLRAAAELNSGGPTERTEIQPLLQHFAKAYRDLLRPVDDMIEDGFRVISNFAVPRTYYLLLRGDAEEVAGFRDFWHRVTEDHEAIEEILCDKHGYEEIADQMESEEEP